jgi:predicted small lipoprotein YifL
MKPRLQGIRANAPASRLRALIIAVLAFGLGLSATGCGNRGPLYLPETAEPVTTADAKAAEEEQEEDDEEADAAPGD